MNLERVALVVTCMIAGCSQTDNDSAAAASDHVYSLQEGAAGSGTHPEEGPQPTLGCNGASLVTLPDDTAVRGPWPVGERTVRFGRFSAVEVFYPAKPGSDAGKEEVAFDLRSFLPRTEQAKVPDAETTVLRAQTYRDLPIDDGHGPYPWVVFVHGLGSFRAGSLSTEALWASRGFVVVAADHPGAYLADYLAANGCAQIAPAMDLNGDVDSEIAAVTTATGDLSFLAGRVDLSRLALSGHSSGAVAVAGFGDKPGVQVIMPLAGTSAVRGSQSLKSVLFVAGMSDNVLPYAPGTLGVGSALYPGNDTDAYTGSAGPAAVRKRLVGISGGGHLNVSDLCQTNPQGQAPLAVAQAHGVCGVDSVLALADCGIVDRASAVQVVNAATAAALEETLQCQERSATFAALRTRYPTIGDYKEAK
jgi:predicted esterase